MKFEISVSFIKTLGMNSWARTHTVNEIVKKKKFTPSQWLHYLAGPKISKKSSSKMLKVAYDANGSPYLTEE